MASVRISAGLVDRDEIVILLSATLVIKMYGNVCCARKPNMAIFIGARTVRMRGFQHHLQCRMCPNS
eukprot:5786381-Amphidinium_carterae.1